MISASVAPFARPIIARIFAPLLSERGALAFARGPFVGVMLALPFFFGAEALAFPALACFWPLGGAFFWLARFFEEAFSGAPCAPCSATVAGVLVCSLVILISNSLLRVVCA